MFPPPFDYRRPATIEDAVTALAEDGTRVLAGGHSLLPALKARSTTADTLVDVTELDALCGIEHDESAGETVLGAAATYADVLADGTLATRSPMVDAAIGAVGDPQIRNRGTVGGNVVQADPGADVPAAAVAAGASVDVVGPSGERTVALDDLYRTDQDADDVNPAASVASDELATAVHLPDADGAGWAYERKTHQATGYALVGVAARVRADEGTISTANVVATGIRRPPVRLTAVEDALAGAPVDADAATAASAAANGLEPSTVRSDPNVSAEYRLRLLEAYTERVVDRSIDRAVGSTGGGRP